MERRISSDKQQQMSPQLKKQALLFKEFLNKNQSRSPTNLATTAGNASPSQAALGKTS
jgi:hypothetical protein